MPPDAAACAAPGQFYNEALRARNVFTLPIPDGVVADARALFEEELRARFLGLTPACLSELNTMSIGTAHGRYFLIQPKMWHSDIAWISPDDVAARARFDDLFASAELGRSLAPHIEHDEALKLYCGYFVLRTACAGVNLHTDFMPSVGCNALTLMTPLHR